MVFPEWFQCLGCQKKYYFPDVTQYLYWVKTSSSSIAKEDELLSIPTNSAWCIKCNSPSYVECISALSEWEECLEVVKLDGYTEKPISAGLMIEEYAGFYNKEDELNTLRKYIGWRKARRSEDKCLECASPNFSRVVDGELVLESPCCSGKSLVYCVQPMGFNGRPKIKIYDSEGGLVSINPQYLNGEYILSHQHPPR